VRQIIQRTQGVLDTSLGERNRAPGRSADLRFALPIDQALKPDIKADQ